MKKLWSDVIIECPRLSLGNVVELQINKNSKQCFIVVLNKGSISLLDMFAFCTYVNGLQTQCNGWNSPHYQETFPIKNIWKSVIEWVHDTQPS